MFSFLTKPFRIATLCWSMLNTGVAMMALQLFAWCQMTHDLSQDMPFLEAAKLVSEGKEDCEICQFCNENNPMDKSAEVEMVLYKSQLLYLSPMPSGLSFPPSTHSIKWATLYPPISSFVSGIEPPPPKFLI